MKAIDRFMDKVIIWPNGCWLWGGSMRVRSYGGFFADGKHHRAHRWIYEHVIGPIPEGHDAHHTCDSPWCVNPYHINPITRKEHSKTKKFFYSNRTHCKRGHPLTGSNVRILKAASGNGYRRCLLCIKESNARRTWDGHNYAVRTPLPKEPDNATNT